MNKSILKKVTAFLMAAMMVMAMSITSFAATQSKYFYTDPAATQAAYMGHGCIASYDVKADGTVDLTMGSETYERNGVTYYGYISSFTANGVTRSDLEPGAVFKFIPAGQITAVTFTITMINMETGAVTQHPATNAYLLLTAVPAE